MGGDADDAGNVGEYDSGGVSKLGPGVVGYHICHGGPGGVGVPVWVAKDTTAHTTTKVWYSMGQ